MKSLARQRRFASTLIASLSATAVCLSGAVARQAPAAAASGAAESAVAKRPGPLPVPTPPPPLPLPEFTADANPAVALGRPMIQLALLLDTSSSMQGLIDQAKTKLWQIVNEFVNVSKAGQTPVFQLALYEYGRNTLPVEQGHVRKVTGFTTDLDLVFEKLNTLQATSSSGSNEYAPWVVYQAAAELGWSPRRDDLKTIYIAGNEAFNQGPVPFATSAETSLANDVTVSTIFCGSHSQGAGYGWKDAALKADGAYVSIDQNRVEAYVPAPQDAEIGKLNAELNKTYVAYGRNAAFGLARQESQDRAAEALSDQTAVTRSITKSGVLYDTSNWDLLSAIEQKGVKLGDIDEKELPENMRKMSPEEREKYVADLTGQRDAIRAKIAGLSKARDHYFAEQRKEAAAALSTGAAAAPAAAGAIPARRKSLDEAIIETLKKSAEKKKFEFKAPEKDKE